jgi:hypothetical protein
VTSPAGAKSVTAPLKPGFPKRFEGVFHHGLDAPIDDGRDAEWSLTLSLGDIDPSNWVDTVPFELTELSAQPPSCFRRGRKPLIHTWGVLTLMHLSDASNAFQHVGATPQHQLLQRPHAFQIAVS